MKITIVSDMITPYMGGSEVYVQNLSKNLVNMGHKVTWVGMRLPNTKQVEINDDGVILRRINVPFRNHAIQSRKMFCFHPQLFKAIDDADVVQWNSFVAAITGGVISKIKQKPHVLLTHEMFQDLWKHFTKNKVEQTVFPLMERLIIKNKYNAAIVPCNYTKETIRKLGMPYEKIKKIPHGLNHKLFKPAKPSFKDEFNLHKKYVIGWCGRFGFKGTSYSKNLYVLFDAFIKLKKKVPNAFLLMAGSDFDSVEWYLQKLGLKENKDYLYLGRLSHKLLPEYYSSLDVFCSSSLSEGFGFTVVEAQACGTPVVCFHAGSLPEVVSHNYSGKVLKKRMTSSGLAKALIELHKYPQVKKKLANQATKWVKQFTWNKSAKAHEKVYEDVYCHHKIMKG
jgi:glycosyltransferase involved in cell wall biosynthesis